MSNTRLGDVALVTVGLVAIVAIAVIALIQAPSPPQPLVADNAPSIERSVGPTAQATVDATAVDLSAPSMPPGCAQKRDAGLQTLQWLEGLETHELLVYIPQNYDPNRLHPVAALFHDGWGQTPSQILELSGFMALADREGVVLAAPSGDFSPALTFRRGVTPRINPWRAGRADAARDALLRLDQLLCTDATRILLIGHEHANHAVTSIACDMDIAAIAFTKRFDKPIRECARRVPRLQLTDMLNRVNPHREADRADPCNHPPKWTLEEHEAYLRKLNSCAGEEREVHTHGESQCVTWRCESPLWSCRLATGAFWRARNIDRCGGEQRDVPIADIVWKFFTSVPVER